MFQQGKRLYVDIIDAEHGDVYFLNFKVKNEGTVPVETKSLVLCSGDALDIKFIHEPESIIDGQDFTEGTIRIKVLKVKEDCTNAFMAQLFFSTDYCIVIRSFIIWLGEDASNSEYDCLKLGEVR